MANQDGVYQTSDFYLCAFLLVKGFQLIDHLRTPNSQRIHFLLRDRPDREQLVKDFFNGKALVDPLEFRNKIKDLKALLFARY